FAARPRSARRGAFSASRSRAGRLPLRPSPRAPVARGLVVTSTSREEHGVSFRNRGGRAAAPTIAARRRRQCDRPSDDARRRRLGLPAAVQADHPAPAWAGVLVAALGAAAVRD